MNVSKAVLITGCSSGIGWATAKHLSSGGWRVYATARNARAIAPLEETGCRLLPLDVTDEESTTAATSSSGSGVSCQTGPGTLSCERAIPNQGGRRCE